MNIREIVIEILSGINPDIVGNEDADLLKDGFLDSFEIVNLVMELEDNFNVEIDPENIVPSNFQTISDIVNLISQIM